MSEPRETGNACGWCQTETISDGIREACPTCGDMRRLTSEERRIWVREERAQTNKSGHAWVELLLVMFGTAAFVWVSFWLYIFWRMGQ